MGACTVSGVCFPLSRWRERVGVRVAPPAPASTRDPTLTQPSPASGRGLSAHPRPIVIAAGGTGGHFFPAEALAAELTARGHVIALMTDARSGGLRSQAFAGRDIFVLRGAGLAGRGFRAATAALALATGTVQARKILRRLNPAVIVGFGGYPCVAPVLAARTLRRRPIVVLHEQNAVLGRANRALARFAHRLALGLPGTQRLPPLASDITGNPVRPALRALHGQGYTPPGDGPIRILVTGGSLGARVFSDVVPAALAHVPHELLDRVHITQQCRAEDLDRVQAAYGMLGIAAELAPFFDGMAERLAAAHLVIARAGASTVAELCVAGRPAILVPLPGAIDGHQLINARASGALVIEQPAFTPDHLAATLTQLLTAPDALTSLAAALAAHARPDAAQRLADLIEQHINAETAP